MRAFLLTLSAGLAITGSSTYVVSILRGKSKPHRITRLVLLFVLLLNFVTIVAAHGNPGAKLFAGIACFYGVLIFILSIQKGMGGASIFDWICFAIAAAGIIGWQVTDEPLLGVWLATLADVIAYLPAYVKTWKHPHTESQWFYSLNCCAAFLSLIAYKIAATSIFQIAIMTTSLFMLFCIYRPRLFPTRN